MVSKTPYNVVAWPSRLYSRRIAVGLRLCSKAVSNSAIIEREKGRGRAPASRSSHPRRAGRLCDGRHVGLCSGAARPAVAWLLAARPPCLRSCPLCAHVGVDACMGGPHHTPSPSPLLPEGTTTAAHPRARHHALQRPSPMSSHQPHIHVRLRSFRPRHYRRRAASPSARCPHRPHWPYRPRRPCRHQPHVHVGGSPRLPHLGEAVSPSTHPPGAHAAPARERRRGSRSGPPLALALRSIARSCLRKAAVGRVFADCRVLASSEKGARMAAALERPARARNN